MITERDGGLPARRECRVGLLQPGFRLCSEFTCARE